MRASTRPLASHPCAPSAPRSQSAVTHVPGSIARRAALIAQPRNFYDASRHPTPKPQSLFSLSVRAQRRTPRAQRAEDSSAALFPLSPLGARAAPHASRPARGRQSSRMPGTKTSDRSWKTRSRSAHEMADLQRLTGQARAFPGRSAGGPAPPSERAQTRVSHRAPKAPRVLLPRFQRAYRRMLTFINRPNPISIVSTLLPP